MKEVPLTETAATGSLGPVMVNLAALLGSEYKLRRRTRRDVKFIKSKFKAMHSLLWDAWEREVPDAASKELKIEALALADEMEDAVDDFILTMEPSRRSKRFIQTKNKANPFEDFKRRANDVSGRCRSKWKKKTAQPICSNLFPRNKPVVKPAPRAHPFVRKDASELVSLDEPKNSIIKFLLGQDAEGTMLETPVQSELKPKMASILGMAGMGKTTLADLVYEEIGNKFGARAFVSVTPGGNMKEFLAEILEQVTADNTSPPAATKAATEEHHLIDQISDFLKDKRYLVIIDDVWHWEEWEIICKSLPQNELGSRVVTTTRINAVAEKWRDDCNALFYEMHPHLNSEFRYVYRTDSTEDVGAQIIAINADMAGEDFNYEHPVVRMCGGMPLAVVCMLSAVGKEREKQAEQGLDATTPDVQDMIEEQVMRHGIQNTPGFEPLVESLQLGYSDLPHHMLKSCLLYCSVHSEETDIWRPGLVMPGLVKEWMAERFILEEETGKSYYAELFSRGLIFNMQYGNNQHRTYSRIHPMMLNFLRWKSREDNFITFSSDIQSSPIRRLCIDSWPSSDAVDHLSGIDWSPIRSLVVHKNAERVPYKHLQRLRVLDVQQNHALANGHLKDMCGLTRMRHLFGYLGSGITEIPSDVAKLQRLETLEVSNTRISELPGVIGALQQLKTLLVYGNHQLKVLPRELGDLQELITLDIMCSSALAELPSEICDLKKLRNLRACLTGIKEVPKEIWKLQQLQSLDMSGTSITALPKEVMKLQNLEELQLLGSKVQKIPWKPGGLKKLKTLKLEYSSITLPLEVCQTSELVKLPECIHQARNNTCVWSSLARENLSFQNSHWMDEGGLVVGANQIRIPSWIKDHFNDLQVLDIRVCKVEEEGLKILREMPRLRNLTLRFAAVPEEPLVIRGEGFASLVYLRVDSPVPRVSFQEGAMPRLKELMFEIQFYGGPPNKSPLGMRHLRSLILVYIEYNKDWYKADRRGIRGTIEALMLEAWMHSKSIKPIINGKRVNDEDDEEGQDKEEGRWWRDQAYWKDVRCWSDKAHWEGKGDGDDEEEGRWWRKKAYWVKGEEEGRWWRKKAYWVKGEVNSDKGEDEKEGRWCRSDKVREESSRQTGEIEESQP